MPESTLAGIITAVGAMLTAVSLVITAIAGLIRAKKIEKKVDVVHKIVNQQRTDMQRYIRALKGSLEAHGIDLPIDQSIDPDENKTQ